MDCYKTLVTELDTIINTYLAPNINKFNKITQIFFVAIKSV